jgi:muconolactone delta-isomerase
LLWEGSWLSLWTEIKMANEFNLYFFFHAPDKKKMETINNITLTLNHSNGK